MEHCVSAEASDVVNKLDYLFAHPDELAAISSAGRRLARERHTMQQRDQIMQWFKLNKQLRRLS
jgi:spore maturation protein CgeB